MSATISTRLRQLRQAAFGPARPGSGPAPAPFNLRLWFGLASFGVIVLIGVAFATLISRFVSDRMLQREAVVTREFLESILRAEQSATTLFSGGMIATNPPLASFVNHIRGMPDVLRANVYAADRSILWSTDPKLIGQRFAGNPELEEAFSDRLVTEIGTLTLDAKAEHADLRGGAGGVFIEVYIPIRGPAEVAGVVELYKVPNALDEMLREGQLIIWLSAAAGVGLLFVTLFSIVGRGARLIEGQQVALGRMESLAAVGQMASAIAHSLRNPLAGIRSSAELLQLEAPELRQVGDDIIGEVDRLDGCVHELLAYARIEVVATQTLDPLDLVQETLARLRTPLARGRVHVALLDRRLVPNVVRVDPQMLGQALTSIITNAIEAMSEGGELAIHIGADGPRATLLFADSGPGIAAGQLARIAEPFFTTKTRGLGLGLALSRRIVERFDGRLTVTSPPGSGAHVQVSLPSAPSA